MSSAQDPFYLVQGEAQDSIDRLQSTFRKWQAMPPDSGQRFHLTQQLLDSCQDIEVQVDELDRTIDVAARNPSVYRIDQAELEKRTRWTDSATSQVRKVKNAVVSGRDPYNASNASGMRRELMKLSNSQQADTSNQYNGHGNDDYISSESDTQQLLIKQQDEELDCHDPKIQGKGLDFKSRPALDLCQGKIVNELGTDMDRTKNRLDFVQKKVSIVMKKAGAKGQIMMILFLLALFIILFVLVFFT